MFTRYKPSLTALKEAQMDAPISLAERAKINAQNQARYEASEQAKLDAQEAKRLARQAGLAARQARMKETSCGSVEQTGNPRAGCDCQTCQRRRTTKTTRQRAQRHRDRGDDHPRQPPRDQGDRRAASRGACAPSRR